MALKLFTIRRKTTNTSGGKNLLHKKQSRGDVTFAIVILGLSIWGILMVYSGSVLVAIKDEQVPYYFAAKQALWVILGLISAFVVYTIDYHIIAKFAKLMLGISLIFMVIVLFFNANDAFKRWISLGGFNFQPVELTKFTFFLYISTWLAKVKDSPKINNTWLAFKHHFKRDLLPFLLLLGGVCLLIIAQPDMDTALLLGVTSFIVYFISGNDFIHLMGSISTGLVLIIIGFFTTLAANYRMSRISNFIQFWQTGNIPNRFGSGYQLMQIIVAVASGGLFGVGFGESRQKFYYLGDTAFTDTMFAIIAEEFGVAGAIVVVALFFFILLRGFKIAREAPDKLGSLIVISMVIWITLQAFLHIATNVGLIPINGNTLPFLSYGGSSTLMSLTAMGLVMNVSRSALKQQNIR
jgi:cell division protein FtsW